MCRSITEGGQRCAAHTRPRFEAASFGTAEWDTAAAEYASTPQGRTALLTMFEGERNTERSIALHSALNRGQTLRDAASATREQIETEVASTSTPHITAETGTNHVYWNQALSAWVTTHSLTNVRRDAARSAVDHIVLDVTSRAATGTRENPAPAALTGQVTVTHNGRGQGFTVEQRNLQCNCPDYQENYDCEHVRQTLADLNERINQERVGRRHVGHVLESEFEQILSRSAQADAVALGEAEVSYVDDPDAFQEAYVQARTAREPMAYSYDNPTGGLGSPNGGRAFGIELEFVGGNTSAIAQELYAAGLTSVDFQQAYHSDVTPRMGHEGGWKFETDCTVTGEVISPVMHDTPETWRNIEQVCDIIKRNGGQASVRAGSHVHVSTANFGSDAAAYSRIVSLYHENEDIFYRVASNPETGEHRLRAGSSQWCRPNPAPGAGFSRIEDVRFGSHSGHHLAVNLQGVQGRSSDQVEYRLWDSTLNPSVIQAQIATSLAVTEAAFRDTDYTPSQPVRLGTARSANPTRARLSAEQWRTTTAGVRSLADRLFRRAEDKQRFASLFAITAWQ